MGGKALAQLQSWDDRTVMSKKADISDKNIDPWVYDKVYDNVNPQTMPRAENGPAPNTYTPYGNPYWPSKLAQARDDGYYWVKPKDYPYQYNPNTDTTVWPPKSLIQRDQILNNPLHNFIQTGFIEDADDVIEAPIIQPADDLAQIDNTADPVAPPELGGKGGDAKKADAKGEWNEFDGTFHNENGARYSPEGKKVQGVNSWLAQADPAAKPAAPAAPAGNATAVNEFDGTVHKDGKRFFPDGKEVKGVNVHLGQGKKDEGVSLRLTQIPKIRSFA